METQKDCSINEITELKKEPADVKAFLLVLKCEILGIRVLLTFGSMLGGIMFISIGMMALSDQLHGVGIADVPLFRRCMMAICFFFGNIIVYSGDFNSDNVLSN